MTLSDRNAPLYLDIFYKAGCVKLTEDRHILSAAKSSSWSSDFSDVQTVHNFAEVAVGGALNM